MEEISIEQVEANEITALQQISSLTFLETFTQGNTQANLDKYVTEKLTVEKLSAELANPESTFYFARFHNKIIGYLKINIGEAQTVFTDMKALEIERIYVLQEFHGKKIGQLLYNKALEFARQIKASYLWLGVWEANERAIRFYSKNGLVAFDKHVFRLGDDEQTDIMMKQELT